MSVVLQIPDTVEFARCWSSEAAEVATAGGLTFHVNNENIDPTPPTQRRSVARSARTAQATAVRLSRRAWDDIIGLNAHLRRPPPQRRPAPWSAGGFEQLGRLGAAPPVPATPASLPTKRHWPTSRFRTRLPPSPWSPRTQNWQPSSVPCGYLALTGLFSRGGDGSRQPRGRPAGLRSPIPRDKRIIVDREGRRRLPSPVPPPSTPPCGPPSSRRWRAIRECGDWGPFSTRTSRSPPIGWRAPRC